MLEQFIYLFFFFDYLVLTMAKLLKNQVFKTTISYQKIHWLLKTLCHIDPCLEKGSGD